MLEAISVCKTFEGKQVLDQFSFRFEEGARYAVMGSSGSGKTTLLNLLMGLMKPDSGKIANDGLRFSAVFQEDRLLRQMTAEANVALVSRASHSEIRSLLHRLGIDDESLPQPVSTYSGGMKRRVALCRALLADYDVLLLDEPYKGLDEDTREQVMQLVNEYTQNKTVILVTHDREEAEGYQLITL